MFNYLTGNVKVDSNTQAIAYYTWACQTVNHIWLLKKSERLM